MIDVFSAQVTNVPRTIVNGTDLIGTNTSAADQNRWVIIRSGVLVGTVIGTSYLQVFNKVASKVNLGTDKPDAVIPVTNTGISIEVGDRGWKLGDAANGASIAATTTRTGSTAAPIDVFLLFN